MLTDSDKAKMDEVRKMIHDAIQRDKDFLLDYRERLGKTLTTEPLENGELAEKAILAEKNLDFLERIDDYLQSELFSNTGTLQDLDRIEGYFNRRALMERAFSQGSHR